MLLPLFITFSFFSISQTIEEIKTPRYYYGEGVSPNLEEATQMALRDLVIQLKASIKVHSNLHQINDVTYFNSNIDLRSDIFLNGISKIVREEGKRKNKQFHVLQYISIDELNKEKACKIYNYMKYIEKGDECLEKLDVLGALKYYYWSFTLTANDWKVSSSRTLDDSDFNVNYFKSKIDSVLSNITFKIKQIAFSGYEVTPFYKSQPILKFSYKVLKGNSWEKVTNNYVQFDEYVPDKITFKIDFETFDGLIKDEETRYILNNASNITFNRIKDEKLHDKRDIVKNEDVHGYYGMMYVRTDNHVGIVSVNGKVVGETPIILTDCQTGLINIVVQDKMTGETQTRKGIVETGTMSMVKIKF